MSVHYHLHGADLREHYWRIHVLEYISKADVRTENAYSPEIILMRGTLHGKPTDS